jgi:hypothetical protein
LTALKIAIKPDLPLSEHIIFDAITFVGPPPKIPAGEQVQAQHDHHVQDRRHMSL